MTVGVHRQRCRPELQCLIKMTCLLVANKEDVCVAITIDSIYMPLHSFGRAALMSN